jgi:transposase-like protein
MSKRNAKIELVRQALAVNERNFCMHFGCKYTPEPKPTGYPDDLRKKALDLYLDDKNLRRIGRQLGIHHRTVALWAKAYASSLLETPMAE